MSMNKKKVQYIWDYYKIPIIAVVAAVGIFLYLAVVMHRPKVEYALRISLVNEQQDVTEGSAFYDHFVAYADETLGESWRGDKEKAIQLDTAYSFDLSKESDFTGNSFRLLVTRIESGEVDGILCSYENLLGIAKGGRVLDLRDDRADAILKNYADRVIYYETEDGGQIPVAIDVTGSSVIAEDTDFGEDTQVCFALSSNVENEKAAQVFLDYLMDAD